MDHVLKLIIYLIVFLARFTKRLSRVGIGEYDEYRSGEKLKILLVGYNGARNTGSDARVVSIASQIKKLFGSENISLTVMTLDKKTLEGYFDEDVALFEFSTVFPLALYRACSVHHAAVLCEGSTLKSTFANGLTLFLAQACGVMAAQNKPCIAYGSEVGKMEPFIKRAVKKLCKDAFFITRSSKSQAALEKLGLSGTPGTDAAWNFEGKLDEKTERTLRESGWDGRAPLVGIAPINPFCWPVRASLSRWMKSLLTSDDEGRYDKWYFYSDSKERREAFDNYLGTISDALAPFIKTAGAFPVIIGMERLDEEACRRLEEMMGGNCALFLSGERRASEMAGVLRELSFLVTSRYHALVLSMDRPVPTVSISMDERLDNIMEEMGMAEKCLVHIRDNKLEESLSEALEYMLSNEASLRKELEKNTFRYREMLGDMGVFLKEYIEEKVQ